LQGRFQREQSYHAHRAEVNPVSALTATDFKCVIARLRTAYGAPSAPPATAPFAIVLYENVAYLVPEERRAAAFERLRRRIGITAQAIVHAAPALLRSVAAEGGVYADLRAARMREAARIVIEEFGGGMSGVLAEPPARRRRLLKKFPAIGDPGADKILLMSRTEPVMALESNGLRVLTRLGFGTESKSYAATYKSVQRALGKFHEPDFGFLIDAHVLLARHGRELCRRTAPLCDPCPLKSTCAYYRSLS
jgi:endonuclease III